MPNTFSINDKVEDPTYGVGRVIKVILSGGAVISMLIAFERQQHPVEFTINGIYQLARLRLVNEDVTIKVPTQTQPIIHEVGIPVKQETTTWRHILSRLQSKVTAQNNGPMTKIVYERLYQVINRYGGRVIPTLESITNVEELYELLVQIFPEDWAMDIVHKALPTSKRLPGLIVTDTPGKVDVNSIRYRQLFTSVSSKGAIKQELRPYHSYQEPSSSALSVFKAKEVSGPVSGGGSVSQIPEHDFAIRRPKVGPKTPSNASTWAAALHDANARSTTKSQARKVLQRMVELHNRGLIPELNQIKTKDELYSYMVQLSDEKHVGSKWIRDVDIIDASQHLPEKFWLDFDPITGTTVSENVRRLETRWMRGPIDKKGFSYFNTLRNRIVDTNATLLPFGEAVSRMENYANSDVYKLSKIYSRFGGVFDEVTRHTKMNDPTQHIIDAKVAMYQAVAGYDPRTGAIDDVFGRIIKTNNQRMGLIIDDTSPRGYRSVPFRQASQHAQMYELIAPQDIYKDTPDYKLNPRKAMDASDFLTEDDIDATFTGATKRVKIGTKYAMIQHAPYDAATVRHGAMTGGPGLDHNVEIEIPESLYKQLQQQNIEAMESLSFVPHNINTSLPDIPLSEINNTLDSYLEGIQSAGFGRTETPSYDAMEFFSEGGERIPQSIIEKRLMDASGEVYGGVYSAIDERIQAMSTIIAQQPGTPAAQKAWMLRQHFSKVKSLLSEEQKMSVDFDDWVRIQESNTDRNTEAGITTEKELREAWQSNANFAEETAGGVIGVDQREAKTNAELYGQRLKEEEAADRIATKAAVHETHIQSIPKFNSLELRKGGGDLSQTVSFEEAYKTLHDTSTAVAGARPPTAMELRLTNVRSGVPVETVGASKNLFDELFYNKGSIDLIDELSNVSEAARIQAKARSGNEDYSLIGSENAATLLASRNHFERLTKEIIYTDAGFSQFVPSAPSLVLQTQQDTEDLANKGYVWATRENIRDEVVYRTRLHIGDIISEGGGWYGDLPLESQTEKFDRYLFSWAQRWQGKTAGLGGDDKARLLNALLGTNYTAEDAINIRDPWGHALENIPIGGRQGAYTSSGESIDRHAALMRRLMGHIDSLPENERAKYNRLRSVILGNAEVLDRMPSGLETEPSRFSELSLESDEGELLEAEFAQSAGGRVSITEELVENLNRLGRGYKHTATIDSIFNSPLISARDKEVLGVIYEHANVPEGTTLGDLLHTLGQTVETQIADGPPVIDVSPGFASSQAGGWRREFGPSNTLTDQDMLSAMYRNMSLFREKYGESTVVVPVGGTSERLPVHDVIRSGGEYVVLARRGSDIIPVNNTGVLNGSFQEIEEIVEKHKYGIDRILDDAKLLNGQVVPATPVLRGGLLTFQTATGTIGTQDVKNLNALRKHEGANILSLDVETLNTGGAPSPYLVGMTNSTIAGGTIGGTAAATPTWVRISKADANSLRKALSGTQALTRSEKETLRFFKMGAASLIEQQRGISQDEKILNAINFLETQAQEFSDVQRAIRERIAAADYVAMHNAAYDLSVLQQGRGSLVGLSKELQNKKIDTMLLAHALEGRTPGLQTFMSTGETHSIEDTEATVNDALKYFLNKSTPVPRDAPIDAEQLLVHKASGTIHRLGATQQIVREGQSIARVNLLPVLGSATDPVLQEIPGTDIIRPNLALAAQHIQDQYHLVSGNDALGLARSIQDIRLGDLGARRIRRDTARYLLQDYDIAQHIRMALTTNNPSRTFDAQINDLRNNVDNLRARVLQDTGDRIAKQQTWFEYFKNERILDRLVSSRQFIENNTALAGEFVKNTEWFTTTFGQSGMKSLYEKIEGMQHSSTIGEEEAGNLIRSYWGTLKNAGLVETKTFTAANVRKNPLYSNYKEEVQLFTNDAEQRLQSLDAKIREARGALEGTIENGGDISGVLETYYGASQKYESAYTNLRSQLGRHSINLNLKNAKTVRDSFYSEAYRIAQSLSEGVKPGASKPSVVDIQNSLLSSLQQKYGLEATSSIEQVSKHIAKVAPAAAAQALEHYDVAGMQGRIGDIRKITDDFASMLDTPEGRESITASITASDATERAAKIMQSTVTQYLPGGVHYPGEALPGALPLQHIADLVEQRARASGAIGASTAASVAEQIQVSQETIRRFVPENLSDMPSFNIHSFGNTSALSVGSAHAIAASAAINAESMLSKYGPLGIAIGALAIGAVGTFRPNLVNEPQQQEQTDSQQHTMALHSRKEMPVQETSIVEQIAHGFDIIVRGNTENTTDHGNLASIVQQRLGHAFGISQGTVTTTDERQKPDRLWVESVKRRVY